MSAKILSNPFMVLLCAMAVSGCDNPDPDDQFKFPEDLDLEMDVTYDAETRNIGIGVLLSDHNSKKPYKLTSFDGPIVAEWSGSDIELSRVGTGRLSGVVPLGGDVFGELQITTNLGSTIRAELTTLEITDVPSLLENSYVDSEVLQIFWSPATNFQLNSDYLSDYTVEVMLRSITCGAKLTEFAPEYIKLSADSTHLSVNTVTTTLPYQSVLDALPSSITQNNEQCELDVSVAATRELAIEPGGTANGMRPLVISSTPAAFANMENGTQMFTFHSEAITLQISLGD